MTTISTAVRPTVLEQRAKRRARRVVSWADARITAHALLRWLSHHCPACGARHSAGCIDGGRCLACGHSLSALPNLADAVHEAEQRLRTSTRTIAPAATKRPAPVKDIFVAIGDDSYLCSDCLNTPEHDALRARLGDEGVDVWEEYSHGWIGSPICSGCKLSLPVYVNGHDDADAEGDDT